MRNLWPKDREVVEEKVKVAKAAGAKETADRFWCLAMQPSMTSSGRKLRAVQLQTTQMVTVKEVEEEEKYAAWSEEVHSSEVLLVSIRHSSSSSLVRCALSHACRFCKAAKNELQWCTPLQVLASSCKPAKRALCKEAAIHQT